MILMLLFFSIVTMATNKQENETKATGILTKTLKDVQSFKKDKNEEIKKLRIEIDNLKKQRKVSQRRQKKELNEQKKEIKKLKKKLKITQQQLLKYKQAQAQVKKQLQVDKDIIKDLHFMLKQKKEVEMDEYALGRYYFNL